MTRTRSRNTSRAGFTLIELLVVIAIIAILVSLTAAAVMKVLLKIPEIQTRTEISQEDAALADFMSTYSLSVPPPSYLLLREDGAYNLSNPPEAATVNFLKQCFGKNFAWNSPTIDWNGNGVIDKNRVLQLQGQHCLVFYLGGIPTSPTSTPGCLGFSTSPINPAQPGGSRRGPFFEFKNNRLVRDPSNGFFVYIDAWKVKASPKPYAYFSTQGVQNGYNPYTSSAGGDCASIGASPYLDGFNTATKTPIYTFNTKYQIISAGQDGAFGSGVWTSGAALSGRDDQANFARTILGAGQ